MDPSLFQLDVSAMLNSPNYFGISNVSATTCSAQRAGKPTPMKKSRPSPCNLDRGSFFTIQAILGLAFFLLVTPTLAQSVANRSSQSSPQVQRSVGIDQP